ncbi:hypothetical protein [Planobispora longispora]|uniref:Secreted protein n=1 Tax=Planobispora longispora TaxID=28887 RepID=A0A8J3W7M2_9ACTN|nr:hypothetical protein [Planobispora longispora]GIH79729.1 hypothetical protein Plo01_61580 [Planobispora longispora]
MRKLVTGAIVTAGVATVLFGGATAALAEQNVSKTLVPGERICVQQYASDKYRTTGTARFPGVRFAVRGPSPSFGDLGPLLSSTDDNSTFYQTEGRSSGGTFQGPGFYAVCAKNNGTTNVFASVRIQTDGDFR